MSCAFLSGLLQKNCILTYLGGIMQKIYLGRISDLETKLPKDPTDFISGFDFKPDTGFSVIITPKDGSNITDVSERTGASVRYVHGGSIIAYANTRTDDRYIEWLTKQDDIFLVFEDRNGNFFIAGGQRGGQITYSRDTGTDSTGSPLDTLTFTANSENTRLLRFFNTDYETTISTLDSLVA